MEKKLYYIEGDRVILTELTHIERGQCCGNGCRHCPYLPKHTKGNIILNPIYDTRPTGKREDPGSET